ncbi:MAG: hypothetical protein ACK56F_28755, partial [bacterium]
MSATLHRLVLSVSCFLLLLGNLQSCMHQAPSDVCFAALQRRRLCVVNTICTGISLLPIPIFEHAESSGLGTYCTSLFEFLGALCSCLATRRNAGHHRIGMLCTGWV